MEEKKQKLLKLIQENIVLDWDFLKELEEKIIDLSELQIDLLIDKFFDLNNYQKELIEKKLKEDPNLFRKIKKNINDFNSEKLDLRIELAKEKDAAAASDILNKIKNI
jgi:hypothetical protein